MIKTLKLHNFGKIKDLEINCANKNVYIVGQNGSGKTTILQAISLALTGKVAKGLTNDLFIGPYDKDFTVVLELDDGTRIGRTAKGAKLQLPNGAIFKKVKDVYEHVGFDPALLFNLSYVRQGEIADLFMSGNGKGVIDKLSSLVIDSKRMSDGNAELNRLIKIKEKDKEYYTESLKQLDEFLNNCDVDKVKAEIEKYTQMEKDLEKTLTYSDTEIRDFYQIHDRYNSVKDNLYRYKADVDSCRERYNAVIKPKITVVELKDKQNKYTSWVEDMEDVEHIKKLINDYNHALRLYANDIDEFINTKFYKVDYTKEELSEISAIENTMRNCLSTEYHFNSLNEAEEFLNRYNTTDHVNAEILLENKMKKDYLVNRLNPYKEVVRNVRSVKANNPDLSCAEAIRYIIDNYAKDIESICDMYADNVPTKVTNEEINALNNQWREYTEAEAQLKKAIATYNNLVKEYKELDEKVKTIPDKDTLDKMKNSKELLSQYYLIKLKCQETLDQYEQTVKSKEHKLKDIEELEESLKKCFRWKEVFGDTPNRLRAVLFNPVVAVLNKEFYELFSFSGLGEIDIDWNKVTITIGEKKFEQLSGAQMVAVGLSLRLALLKVMGECVPIMLVDEPTTFLDDDRKNDIGKLLSHMSSVSQCFVSTHDDNIISANSVVVNLNK